MRTRYLSVLLLYSLFIISAMAMDNINRDALKLFSDGPVADGSAPREAEATGAAWQYLAANYSQSKPSPSYFSLAAPLHSPAAFSGRESSATIWQEAAAYAASDHIYILGDIHSDRVSLMAGEDESAANPLLFGFDSDIRSDSAATYFYEKDMASPKPAVQQWLQSGDQTDPNLIIGSLYEPGRIEERKPIKSNLFDSYASNRHNLEQFASPEEEEGGMAKSAESAGLTAAHLQQLLNENPSPAFDHAPPQQNLTAPRYEWSRKRQDYAIVVGIDDYAAQSGLHSCVNDANSVAGLMKDLGYKVILISDSAERKPTKGNILDPSIKELILNNDGNVIFYFSGHGIKDDNDTFYLIPQDASGNSSTYISEYEFKQYISDLPNLAIILDVCNGAGMSESIASGQLMIASSEEDEPSNEEWTGSMSVFTQNLVEAIQAERQSGGRILLQSCFGRALNETVLWSKGHFIRQTPVLVDRTGGRYYLN